MSESPTTVPSCYRHPSRETYVRCTRCDRAICPECMREASVGHQCPECVAEGRRTQRPARTVFGGGAAGRLGYVTTTLIGVNVVVMLLSILSDQGGDSVVGGTGFGGLLGGTTPLTDWGAVLGHAAFVAGGPAHGVAAGEFYRLFTAMFLHYGVIHLLMNMWALWVLGRTLEATLGPLRFLALYLIGGLGGNVAAYLFTAQNVPTAGASTAIFGLFAALFIIMRRLGRDTSSVVPILVINLIFTFTIPNISIAGHLGGLVAGGLMALVLAYAPRSRRSQVQVAGGVVILLALVGLTLLRTAAILG